MSYIYNLRFIRHLDLKCMKPGYHYMFHGAYANIHIPSTLHLYTDGEKLYDDSMEWVTFLDDKRGSRIIDEIYITRPFDDKHIKPWGTIDYQNRYDNVKLFYKNLPGNHIPTGHLE